ncbi:unnamed protein product [Caretta caretta]
MSPLVPANLSCCQSSCLANVKREKKTWELERPEVSNFHTVVGKIQEVPFGLSTNPEVLSHYNITSNTISIFRMVDDKRQDLELTDGKKMDATKMSRFIRINELRLVTEYNPVTAIGLFNSTVQTHLLLFTDKTSQDHTERVRRYREAAELFRGKSRKKILPTTRMTGEGREDDPGADWTYQRLKRTPLTGREEVTQPSLPVCEKHSCHLQCEYNVPFTAGERLVKFIKKYCMDADVLKKMTHGATKDIPTARDKLGVWYQNDVVAVGHNVSFGVCVDWNTDLGHETLLILFILVDSKVKGNERVISFFNLKKSQLPALAIFHMPDEEQDVLPLGEVTVERVQDFCNGFLERKQRKEDPSPEEKTEL